MQSVIDVADVCVILKSTSVKNNTQEPLYTVRF